MDTRDDWASAARRMWLWPVAILVGFPIGGLVADGVVDGVDSVGAALPEVSSRAQSSERQSGWPCGGGFPGSGSRRQAREWPRAWPREQLWSITG